MSKVLALLILMVFAVGDLGAKDYSTEITAYKAEYLEPEVTAKIINIIDSIQRSEVRDRMYAVYRMSQNIEAGDTSTASYIFGNMSGSFLNAFDFVVVNNKFRRKGSGLSIHLLVESSISNRIYGVDLWSLNKVRKYGYCTILGHKILLVDLNNGFDYFKVSDKYSQKFNLKRYRELNPNDVATPYLDAWWEFVYNREGKELVPIVESWPLY